VRRHHLSPTGVVPLGRWLPPPARCTAPPPGLRRWCGTPCPVPAVCVPGISAASDIDRRNVGRGFSSGRVPGPTRRGFPSGAHGPASKRPYTDPGCAASASPSPLAPMTVSRRLRLTRLTPPATFDRPALGRRHIAPSLERATTSCVSLAVCLPERVWNAGVRLGEAHDPCVRDRLSPAGWAAHAAYRAVAPTTAPAQKARRPWRSAAARGAR
jgi:hypothetical protein